MARKLQKKKGQEQFIKLMNLNRYPRKSDSSENRMGWRGGGGGGGRNPDHANAVIRHLQTPKRRKTSSPSADNLKKIKFHLVLVEKKQQPIIAKGNSHATSTTHPIDASRKRRFLRIARDMQGGIGIFRCPTYAQDMDGSIYIK